MGGQEKEEKVKKESNDKLKQRTKYEHGFKSQERENSTNESDKRKCEKRKKSNEKKTQEEAKIECMKKMKSMETKTNN